jgi:hypothetical protein
MFYDTFEGNNETNNIAMAKQTNQGQLKSRNEISVDERTECKGNGRDPIQQILKQRQGP